MTLLRVQWPDGSVYFFDLLTYCSVNVKLLSNTKVRLVTVEEAAKEDPRWAQN